MYNNCYSYKLCIAIAFSLYRQARRTNSRGTMPMIAAAHATAAQLTRQQRRAGVVNVGNIAVQVHVLYLTAVGGGVFGGDGIDVARRERRKEARHDSAKLSGRDSASVGAIEAFHSEFNEDAPSAHEKPQSAQHRVRVFLPLPRRRRQPPSFCQRECTVLRPLLRERVHVSNQG